MTIGLSLPMVGPANGLSGSQTARSDGNVPSPDKVVLQKPSFEVMSPSSTPVGASEMNNSAPVTQATPVQTDNKNNHSNSSQKFGLAAVALETILKNVVSSVEETGAQTGPQSSEMKAVEMGGRTEFAKSFLRLIEPSDGEEIVSSGSKPLALQEPSFQNGLDMVRSMERSDQAKESRLA